MELRGLDGVVGEGESPLWLVDLSADAVTRALVLLPGLRRRAGK